MPGYGRSDKPDVTYDCEWINATLIGLVDAMGRERVVIAGHDWGGLLVWIMARQYPERIAGVIGVNTPDLPRPPMPPVQLLRQIFADTPIYIIQFQERGVAEWVLGTWGRGADDFVEMIFGGDDVNADAFPPDVLDVYKDAFRPQGALTPPLEYYRNMDRNWELTAAIADRKIEVPCLMISAADDPVLTPAMTTGMEERVPEPRAGRDRELRALDPAGTARGDHRRDARLPPPPRLAGHSAPLLPTVGGAGGRMWCVTLPTVGRLRCGGRPWRRRAG